MPLQAVFLDVGDTLLREREPRHALYAAAARERGLAVDDERMLELMRAAHRSLPRRIEGAYRYSDAWFRAFIAQIYVRELGLAAHALPALEDELFALFEQPASFRVFAGVPELFESVRSRGLKLGLVSNWSARLPQLVRALGWEGQLDFCVCSALVESEKPERQIFECALECAGVAPTQALHAGDHPEKDGAAAALGLAVVLVDHDGTIAHGSLPRARDLAQLGEHILERCG
jgi:REG-2-like HAD superfamily hydrolase